MPSMILTNCTATSGGSASHIAQQAGSPLFAFDFRGELQPTCGSRISNAPLPVPAPPDPVRETPSSWSAPSCLENCVCQGRAIQASMVSSPVSASRMA
eukprot:1367314-Rhodomonas_salina.1